MNELKPGARLKLRVDRLSLGGDAIGRVGGAVVFVPYGAPGDTLEVELTEVRQNFSRARLIQVIEPSSVRTAPPCPYHFNADNPGQHLYCGGCTWQYLNYPFQLDAKRQLLQETLERLGGATEVEVRPTWGMQDPWRYRNKVQQPVGWDGRRVISGFYAPFSHDIVPIQDCLIQSTLSVRLINRVRELAQTFHLAIYDEKQHQGWLRHLWVRTQARQALLVWVTRTGEFPHEAEIMSHLRQEFPELVGVHQNVNPGRTNVILGRQWRRCWGADYLEESLGDLRFRLSPGSFFQVNTQQTGVLYDQVKAAAGKGDVLLDLYCGVGSIALWLAKNFKEVIGVEEVRHAIVDAEKNAELNGITHARFFAAPVERFIASAQRGLRGRNLVVVLDPPRSGCDPRVLQALLQLRPRNVVYVSCDPGTLARDVKALATGGYHIKIAQPVDLFPHTPHIESVIQLTLPKTQ